MFLFIRRAKTYRQDNSGPSELLSLVIKNYPFEPGSGLHKCESVCGAAALPELPMRSPASSAREWCSGSTTSVSCSSSDAASLLTLISPPTSIFCAAHVDELWYSLSPLCLPVNCSSAINCLSFLVQLSLLLRR